MMAPHSRVRAGILAAVALMAGGLLAGHLFAAEDSPIVSKELSTDNGPAATTAARERGAATAARDIKAGTLRILYFGKPWSMGKPLVDDATGYRVQVVAGCVVGQPFAAEVEAYNGAMREWHAKNR